MSGGPGAVANIWLPPFEKRRFAGLMIRMYQDQAPPIASSAVSRCSWAPATGVSVSKESSACICAVDINTFEYAL